MGRGNVGTRKALQSYLCWTVQNFKSKSVQHLHFLKLHKFVSVTKYATSAVCSDLTMNKHNTVSIERKSFSYMEVQQSNPMTLKTNIAFILCNTNFTMLRFSIVNNNN